MAHEPNPSAQFPEEQSPEGAFERQEDVFRHKMGSGPESKFPAAKNRYHLYVSLACPWACRTLICRELLGLQAALGVTVVDPVRDERGWAFREGRGHGLDSVEGFSFLAEAYERSMPGYRGRVTVPVLWDRQTRQIVNNSEDDICRMMNESFRPWAETGVDLFPAAYEEAQESLSGFIYEAVNNGVYQAGFATTQEAYEQAARRLFGALDELEERLASSRYLLGSQCVETDWRLFCTLIRFDAVYHGHFKCNWKRVEDYPHLSGYVRDLYQTPGIAETVNLDHIKRHYYMTHTEINPTRLVPIGPELDFTRPHDRADRFAD